MKQARERELEAIVAWFQAHRDEDWPPNNWAAHMARLLTALGYVV